MPKSRIQEKIDRKQERVWAKEDRRVNSALLLKADLFVCCRGPLCPVLNPQHIGDGYLMKKGHYECKTCSNARTNAWAKANPMRCVEAAERRRVLGAALPLEPIDWEDIQEYFQNCCAYCEASDARLTRDHFIPIQQDRLPSVMRGLGGTVWWNMVPACMSCNSSKSNKNPFTWLKIDHPIYEKLRGRVPTEVLELGGVYGSG